MTRILRFAFQQFGHAEDAGQRGTHIVGHVGEEGALGAVGGFGKLLLAVDLERGPADPHHADDPDDPECEPGGALAFGRRCKKGLGGDGYADAAEHVADLLVLMALDAAFLGGQGGHIAVTHTLLVGNEIEKLVPVLFEREQGPGFPLIGPVFRTLRGQAGNAEARQRGGEAFRDLPGHIGGVDLHEGRASLGAECALLLRQPRVGGAAGVFADPDAAVVGVPVAGIHDAGKERRGLDAGQSRGILVLALGGPAEQREQQQPPEQGDQQGKAQHAP